jgi:hypothetical protein
MRSWPIFIPWSKQPSARSVALLALLPLPACDGIQSVLDPRGPDAQQIAVMSWILFTEGALIFLVAMALAAYALFASPNRRAKIGRRDLIIGGGILFPVVMLSALLIYSLTVADAIVGKGEPAALRIEVVGEQWWWQVHYLDGTGKPQVVAANEIHIPVGTLFLSKECGREDCCVDCHTIRGTPADGKDGPDLTHVGSRRSIAAGILPNNIGTLAGWIADSQHIKPENRMPSFDISRRTSGSCSSR